MIARSSGDTYNVTAKLSKYCLTIDSKPLSLVESLVIDSCLMRGDYETARKHIAGWNLPAQSKPEAWVSKWMPGNHYYALDEKFSRLDAAIRHLRMNGYKYAGIRERFQYRESGG